MMTASITLIHSAVSSIASSVARPLRQTMSTVSPASIRAGSYQQSDVRDVREEEGDEEGFQHDRKPPNH
jgi:hypothetical protein